MSDGDGILVDGGTIASYTAPATPERPGAGTVNPDDPANWPETRSVSVRDCACGQRYTTPVRQARVRDGDGFRLAWLPERQTCGACQGELQLDAGMDGA